MAHLLVALLLVVQEPSIAELIKRLDSERFQDREEAEAALLTRGAAALKEVEAALASAASAELRIRLGRLVRPLRLAELTQKIPSQFSETFRAAAPELLDRLKKPDPGVLIEAIAATAGKAWHWETEEKPGSHGTYKVAKEITREPAKGVTRADVAEVIHIALRALPEKPLDERWRAVERSARGAIKIEEGADRRILARELLALRSKENGPSYLQEILTKCREADDIPFALALLEDSDPKVAQYAGMAIQTINPGPYADDLVKRLPGLKPASRAAFLRSLQNTKDTKYLKLYLELVDDPEVHVKWAAFGAAQATDPDALIDVVTAKLKSKEDDQNIFGLQMAFRMKRMGKPPKREFVQEAGRLFASSKNEKVQFEAFNLMVWAQGEGCTQEQVLFALAHPTAGVRRHATSFVGKFQSPEVFAALAKLVDDPDDEVAAFATVTLVGLKQDCTLDRVRAILKKPASTNAISQSMMSLVYRLGKEARPDLVPLLDHDQAIIQTMALQQFATLGAAGFEERIRPKLDSKESGVALAAVMALAPTGDASCWPTIKKLMAGSDWPRVVPCAATLAWPEKSKAIEAIKLKVPDEGTTAAALLEDLRGSLKAAGIALAISLGPEALAAAVKRPPMQEKTVFWFVWLPSLLQDSFWFFDGETLVVLPRKEARLRWIEWSKKRL